MNSGYHKNLVFTAAVHRNVFFRCFNDTWVRYCLLSSQNLEFKADCKATSLVTFLPIGMLAVR